MLFIGIMTEYSSDGRPDTGYSHRNHDKNLFQTVGDQVKDLIAKEKSVPAGDSDEGEGPKVVDEIESLCMNCEENVRSFSNQRICKGQY